MIRPHTHPSDLYRRSESTLQIQLLSTLRIIRELDPVDFHVKAGDLIDMLEEAISTLEHARVCPASAAVTPLELHRRPYRVRRRWSAQARLGIVLAAVLVVLGVAVDRADASTYGRCPQYEGLLAAHGLPVATFSRIMWRESRCLPWVTNRRSGAAGLLQILPAHAGRWRTCPGANLHSVSGNLICAARLYHRAGLRPWR